ncbi:Transcriptional regulators [Kluyvera cryocrescens]|uniref:Transcriptional regulators n=1 Tax=Kluyvera cryocrescens TaxID=580 RepID=A0A485A6P3_KLUCR|nr:Transcriptional regulators [Kluyvera cryocrescens]
MTAMTSEPTPLLAHSERVYLQLRQEIYQFVLLPGDRFTEVDIARRLGCSRTPVREALLLLQNEGLVRRCLRNGWEVFPIDFDVYEDLYEDACADRDEFGQKPVQLAITEGQPGCAGEP